MPVRHIYRGGMESMEQSCLFMLESGDPRMDEEKLSRRETSCVFLYDQGSNGRSLHDVNLLTLHAARSAGNTQGPYMILVICCTCRTKDWVGEETASKC